MNEIKSISSLTWVEFQHVRRSANACADSLAKQGVRKFSPFVISNL